MSCFSMDTEATEPREHVTLLKPWAKINLFSFKLVFCQHDDDKDVFLEIIPVNKYSVSVSIKDYSCFTTNTTWKTFVPLMLVCGLAYDRSSVEHIWRDTQDTLPGSPVLVYKRTILSPNPYHFHPHRVLRNSSLLPMSSASCLMSIGYIKLLLASSFLSSSWQQWGLFHPMLWTPALAHTPHSTFPTISASVPTNEKGVTTCRRSRRTEGGDGAISTSVFCRQEHFLSTIYLSYLPVPTWI